MWDHDLRSRAPAYPPTRRQLRPARLLDKWRWGAIRARAPLDLKNRDALTLERAFSRVSAAPADGVGLFPISRCSRVYAKFRRERGLPKAVLCAVLVEAAPERSLRQAPCQAAQGRRGPLGIERHAGRASALRK